ncbi:efflux RND transporter periplasmic adaptor subunit [Ottowia sp. GY511]|uniref:Efflux RND transporter periplasmic adaptor subunit n=1 Tax=Ottowia flava TaxID=2675430 RepID=A0ABW4KVA0_9BURK|nr:efflux RND transporter periplasmic adaptor subunit [Ottowia sp. GY511]TXK26826.1 efflux RND transporter periplasmic adaptor subunit [Ottowia sp. GY511]
MNPSLRRALAWAVLVLVLLALALFGLRGWQARKAAAPAAASAPRATVIELAPTDVATARVVDLQTGLPVSGALKAVQTALVKARVPGELQGLTVREGDAVQAGQVLARIDSSDHADRLRQAEQQASAAQAQVAIAQRQYDNNAALVQRGFISQTALDTSLSTLNAAQATYRAARAGAEVARKSVSDTVVRAPIAGQIARRVAQPGERVVPEAPIVEIVDLRQLELEAPLSPADSVAVRVGQRATLHIEGVAQPVTATVARINPSAQAGSRSVLVYLTVAPQPGLRQGLFAQGELATARLQALAVPLDAVRTDKPTPYVQVAQAGHIAHVPVRTGVRGEVDGALWVAVEGVAGGAQVLRGSAGALREGTAVRALAPAAAPPAPASAAG